MIDETAESFFEIKNFSCGYSSNEFKVRNINISFSKKDFVGIIGPNGSGKTTLFRGIIGELKNINGTILLNGKCVHDMGFKEKARNLAIVSQNIDAPDILVEDYVIMGRLPHHEGYQFFETDKDIKIAEKYMAMTGITHLRGKYMDHLSGGEQQLVSIARALAQEPELLLLDEPTSHLDITHQVQVLNMVQRLNEELGLTVLMIIHDLNLAGEYCNQLILINNGEVHIKGSPHEVLNYKHIESVYGTVVVTETNPLSGNPVLFLVSEKVAKQNIQRYKK